MNEQLALAIKLDEEATLEDFYWENNQLLRTQLNSMLHFKDERFLYLWGTKSSGKSHVLQACCQEINQDQSAMYVPLSQLAPLGPEILMGIEDQALICIDDIDAIAKNVQWEEALFHLYNRVKDEAKTLLFISGSVAPAQLPIQLPDLRSRCSWGLVLQLHELSDLGKVRTLVAHALKRGFELSETVAHFLLSRCSRSMHDLFRILNHLDEASLVAQRKITIPFVKETLGL